MKMKLLGLSLVLLALAFTACDDTTDTIGSSLIDEVDKLEVDADTFEITSKTIAAGPVLARNIMGYLGKVKDPETGTTITGDYMAQFNTLESFEMPDKDSLVTWQKEGKIIADSCEIRLYFNDYYGDSLSQMKLTAYELDKPMEENTVYYSDYNPLELIRSNGIKQNRTYTLDDMTERDSIRASENYVPNIRIKLNQEYTDKDGNPPYNNYGTYLMQKYYENPEDFKDAYKFVHNIMPGFFFKMTNGIGSMAYISTSQLYIYFRYNPYGEKKDTVIYANTSFTGTEEVLQTTTFTNDDDRINELAEDKTCTYLKTPAGLFTELTLPVDDIMTGHEGETLNTARTEIKRINNSVASKYALDIPQTLLMVPKDSLERFFSENKLPDYKTSFIATYSSTNNSYTFGNISGVIDMMYNLKQTGKAGEDWNKVVLVPVTLSTSSSSSDTSSSITKLTHDMSMTSTRLVGGEDNPNGPIKISVIYSKFHGR